MGPEAGDRGLLAMSLASHAPVALDSGCCFEVPGWVQGSKLPGESCGGIHYILVSTQLHALADPSNSSLKSRHQQQTPPGRVDGELSKEFPEKLHESD